MQMVLHYIYLNKHYIVIFDCDKSSDYSQWVAIKENNHFFAESPKALLGLINIYEILGDDWNKYFV